MSGTEKNPIFIDGTESTLCRKRKRQKSRKHRKQQKQKQIHWIEDDDEEVLEQKRRKKQSPQLPKQSQIDKMKFECLEQVGNKMYIPQRNLNKVRTQKFTMRDINDIRKSNTDIPVYAKRRGKVKPNEHDLTLQLSQQCLNIPKVINLFNKKHLILQHCGCPIGNVVWRLSPHGKTITFAKWLENKHNAAMFEKDMMNVLTCLYKNGMIHSDLGYLPGQKKEFKHGYKRNILFDVAAHTKRFYVIDFGDVKKRGEKDMTNEEFAYWTPEIQFQALLDLVKQKKNWL